MCRCPLNWPALSEYLQDKHIMPWNQRRCDSPVEVKLTHYPFGRGGKLENSLLGLAYGGGAAHRIDIPQSRVGSKAFDTHLAFHLSADPAQPDNAELCFV